MALIAQLHQKIGQLTVDLDWLKKVQATGRFSMFDRSRFAESALLPVRALLEVCRVVIITVPVRGRKRTCGADAVVGPDAFGAIRFMAVCKLTVLLLSPDGFPSINRKRVVRLLRVMGIEAIYAQAEG